MAMMVPHEGQLQLATDLLAGGTLENWTLRLYKSNTTPAETDTVATYTTSTFTGYVDKTLTRSISAGTWQTPSLTGSVLASGCGKSTYGAAAQSWSATSVETVVGYLVFGATSGKLIQAEKFAASITTANPSTVTLTPSMEFNG